MLGKLIGYETKAFSRIMLPLYGAALAFSLFMGIGLRILPNDFFGGLPAVLMIMVYTFLLLAVMIMTGILAVTRFYNNLLGREGYLMFSLPAGTLSLISSKVISLIIWSALSTITAILTVVLCALGAGGLEILKEFPDFVQYLLQWESLPDALSITGTTAVLMVVATSAMIVKIYAAIAVGHQFNGHRVLWSVLAYVGFQMIRTTFSSVLAMIESQTDIFSTWIESIASAFEAESVGTILMIEWGSVLTNLVILAIYGALTWVLLDRKLNLE